MASTVERNWGVTSAETARPLLRPMLLLRAA
jgi:hypothetical protein